MIAPTLVLDRHGELAIARSWPAEERPWVLAGTTGGSVQLLCRLDDAGADVVQADHRTLELTRATSVEVVELDERRLAKWQAALDRAVFAELIIPLGEDFWAALASADPLDVGVRFQAALGTGRLLDEEEGRLHAAEIVLAAGC